MFVLGISASLNISQRRMLHRSPFPIHCGRGGRIEDDIGRYSTAGLLVAAIPAIAVLPASSRFCPPK
jgi:hypothetical protein